MIKIFILVSIDLLLFTELGNEKKKIKFFILHEFFLFFLSFFKKYFKKT